MKLFVGALAVFFCISAVRASFYLDQLKEEEEIEIAYHQNFITISDGSEHFDWFNCSIFVHHSGQADNQYVVRIGNLEFGSARPNQHDEQALQLPFLADFNERGRWKQIKTPEHDTEWSIKLKAYLIGLINDNSVFFDKYLVLSTVGFENKNDVNESDLKCNGKATVYEIRPYSYIHFLLHLEDDNYGVKRDYDFTVTFNSEPAQLEAAQQSATTQWSDGRVETKYFDSRIVQFTPIHTQVDLGSLTKKYKGRPRREQGLFLESFERCQGLS